MSILSTADYLDGIGALWLSLQKTKTQIPFYVLTGPAVSRDAEVCMQKAGIKILRYTKPVDFPHCINESNHARNNDNWNHTFDKLLIFELTQFRKIVFTDADMMVMQNIDHLFAFPHMSATNAGHSFPGNEKDIDLNSGLMVIEPTKDIVKDLTKTIPDILKRKKAFGDQDILQEYYSDWTLRPELNFGEKYNIYACYLSYYMTQLHYHFSNNHNDPLSIAIVHFIGASKPWHSHWSLLSIIFQEIKLKYRNLIGKHDTQWAHLEYKHLIRKFRIRYKTKTQPYFN